MTRLTMIGLVAGLLLVGGCKKNTLPDVPEPEIRVELIDMPGDLEATARDEEWAGLVQFFNNAAATLNRVATNVDQLGDKATAELKSSVTQAETSLKDLRGKVAGARASGSLDALRGEIQKVLDQVDALKSQLVQ